MGKSRRNRAHAHRADPIARKAPKSPTNIPPELAAVRENRVLPVISKLRSCDPKARTEAAVAIGNIVDNEQCRKLLLREQIVHVVLTETLTDASVDSRAAGWSILKVLVSEEDDGFCMHLFRLDVLTAIEHAAKAIVESINGTEPPFKKLLKAQQRLVWEISESLITLLGALAQARDEIFKAVVSNKNLIRFLFCVMSAESAPIDVIDAALSCLTTLAEDNLELGQAVINDQSWYNSLIKLTAGAGEKAAAACNVLHNIFLSLQWQDHSPGKNGTCDAILVPALSRLISQAGSPADAVQLGLLVLASIATDLEDTLEKGNKVQHNTNNNVEEEWNGIDEGDAMEVDQEGEDEDEDEDADADVDADADEDNAEEDESDMDDIDADMEKVTGRGDDDTEKGSGLDDLPTLREFLHRAIPHIIRLSQTAPGSDEAVAIRGYALSALNNISWTVSCLDFADPANAGIRKVWQPVAQKIWSKTVAPILTTDDVDLELATAVTTLAWAVARTLPGSVPLTGDEHRKFMSLYHASKTIAPEEDAQEPTTGRVKDLSGDPFSSLSVRCIGVLGQLARDPHRVETSREVGVFLFTVLAAPQTPIADLIEAADQVFDIWADETQPCEEIFWREDFLTKLEALVPRFKAMIKGIDKRKFTELRTRADEVSFNLGRFIQYKKKHRPGEGQQRA